MRARSEETRTHILEAASLLFAQEGYEASSVAEICLAAGVSKGAFYHHFPTKQAIFLELLELWLDAVDEHFAHLRREAGSVPEAILQMASTAGGIFKAAGVKPTIFLEFWMQAVRDPQVWQAAIAPYRRYRSYFASLIQAGIDEGSFQPVDTLAAAHSLVSLAVGLLMQDMFDPLGADWENIVVKSVQVFLNGLQRGEA